LSLPILQFLILQFQHQTLAMVLVIITSLPIQPLT